MNAKQVIRLYGGVALVAGILALPFTREELHWLSASRRNTIATLQRFQHRWPGGRHDSAAQDRIRALKADPAPFARAEAAGTPEQWEAFLRDFPGHVKEAEALYRRASKVGYFDAWADLLRTHPDTPWTAEAEERMLDILIGRFPPTQYWWSALFDEAVDWKIRSLAEALSGSDPAAPHNVPPASDEMRTLMLDNLRLARRRAIQQGEPLIAVFCPRRTPGTGGWRLDVHIVELAGGSARITERSAAIDMSANTNVEYYTPTPVSINMAVTPFARLSDEWSFTGILLSHGFANLRYTGQTTKGTPLSLKTDTRFVDPPER